MAPTPREARQGEGKIPLYRPFAKGGVQSREPAIERPC